MLLQKVLFFFVGLTLCLSICGSAANGNTMAEYRQILQETLNYRQYDLEDLPLNVGQILQDKDGVLWLISMRDLYRFNGVSLSDELQNLPKVERDSCMGYVMSKDRTSHFWGHHFLYKWDGIGFEKYEFPNSDRIVYVTPFGSKIICIGTMGYAVLDEDEFRYYPFTAPQTHNFPYYSVSYEPTLLSIPINDYCIDNEDRLMVLNYDLYYKSIEYMIVPQTRKWNQDIYLKVQSPQAPDSLLIATKEELNEIHGLGLASYPKMISIANSVWIYLPYSGIIGKVDSSKQNFVRSHIESGVKIYHLFGDYVVYEQQNHFFLSSVTDFVNSKPPLCDLGLNPQDLVQYNVYLQLDDSFSQINFNQVRSNQEAPTKILQYQPESKSVKELKIAALDQVYANFSGTLLHPKPHYLKGHLVFSIQNPDIANTHTVYLYNFADESIRILRVADESSELRPLHYDPQVGCLIMQSSKKLYFLQFKNLFETQAKFPYTGVKHYDYQHYTCGGEDIIVKMERISQAGATFLQTLLFKLEQGSVRKIQELKNTFVLHASEEQKILYLLHISDSKRYIQIFDTSNSRLRSVTEIAPNQRISFNKDGFLIIGSDAYTYHAVKQDHAVSRRGELDSFTKVFSQVMETHHISPAYLWEHIREGEYLGNGLIFFEQRSLSINIDGSLTPYETTPVRNKSGYITELRVDEHDKKILRIPPFVIDAFQDKLIFQPAWNEAFSSNGKSFVRHWEDQGEQVTFCISQVRNGVLHPDENDFRVSINSLSIPFIRPNPHLGGYSVSIGATNSLYYYWKNTWHLLNLKRFNNDQLSHALLYAGDILWLQVSNKIIKYLPDSDLAFTMTRREGLPQKIEIIFTDTSGELKLIGDHALLAINQDSNVPRLDIPWMIVNGVRTRLEGKLSFSYRQNNLVFPLEIRNLANPQNCMIEYRIKGLDNTWQTLGFQENLESLRMRPGSYRLEIKAYSTDGKESETTTIVFRIRPPWYASWWALLFYLIVVLLMIRLYLNYKLKRLKKEQEHLEKVVQDSTTEIREQHRKIDESISYSAMIQRSILPPRTELETTFDDLFIIWRPRDIVGGDFYWFYKYPKSSDTLFAVIDCTGHGVPGALLCMTVNTLLTNIVKDGSDTTLAQILGALQNGISRVLHQTSEDGMQDGLAISIIRVNSSRDQICFAGAGQDLLYICEGDAKITRVRGIKKSLGGAKWHENLDFEEHEISISRQMRLYLYSDGIIDQPGRDTPKLRKLGNSGMMDLLQNVANLSMMEQEQRINIELDNMLSRAEQRDDICFICLKFN